MAARKKSASQPAPEAADDGGPSFEEALERLETIVEELEGGALTLEQSLARYEEGVRLSRRLTQTLDQAEKRIERLTESGGEPATVPVELEEDEGESASGAAPPARTPERAAGGARPRPAATPPPDELPF
ncbi:MAG TPA: exodeoxyribonuclease VII small subunit [Candidatus Eisenbacteria bacterium]|jgi:exodeoxyribonuclease VII small subunit